MSVRDRILEVAVSKLGDYGKGSREVLAIWRDVLPANVTEAQVKQAADKLEWCGAFALHCLREAGVTQTHWVIGEGFVLRLLTSKAATKTPQPGDIGITQGPPERRLFHHFIVTNFIAPHDWDSIDGNSPHCAHRRHAALDPTTTFYSVQSLLPAGDHFERPEAGFVRGQPFAIPGIQD